MKLTVQQQNKSESLIRPLENENTRNKYNVSPTQYYKVRVNLVEILQRAHSENFHLSKCSPGYFQTLEILQLCPQREFPSAFKNKNTKYNLRVNLAEYNVRVNLAEILQLCPQLEFPPV